MHKTTPLPCKFFQLTAAGLGLAGIVFWGCEALSVPEPGSDYDTSVDVLAVVNPDSMQAGQTYRIQICFQNIPCGTFTHNERATNGSQVALTPIIHVVSQSNCPLTGQVQTVTDTVRFSSVGTYQLFVFGHNATFVDSVNVVSSFPRQNIYSLRYRFQTLYSAVDSPYFAATVSFLNRPPSYSFTIMANSLGEWDTTFVDTLPFVRYTIQADTLVALPGIKENGIILVL